MSTGANEGHPRQITATMAPTHRAPVHNPEPSQPRDWRTMGIVELAVENQSVSDYIEHWEGRCHPQPISGENFTTDDGLELIRQIGARDRS